MNFTVPGQPVGMQRHRQGRGHLYIPAPTREYQERVLTAWQVDTGRSKLTGPLRMRAVFVMGRPKSHLRVNGEPRQSAPPYPAKPDSDNLVKSCLDALNQHAYDDDGQVVELSVVKRYSVNGEEAHTEVELEPHN